MVRRYLVNDVLDAMKKHELKLHREGVRDFRLVTQQIGDDGIYRKVETSNYFVKSPASEDVLVISLCNNLET